MDETRSQRLAEFVAYAKALDGDEKGEAQVYLDRLFRAFGQAGYKEAGAKLEMRVKNDRGGTAFADLVWKPIVLIEMKKRGEDLARHLIQAFDYWVRLVPNRPRYVVLCNFDEFRIYDFDKDINDPQDTLTLDELPTRFEPLAFLFPTNEKPRFRVDREQVTRESADLLAAVYKSIHKRPSVGQPRAQRFILQVLIALFSEDIGLLPRHFFTQLLDDCIDPPKAFDLFDGLFRAMNTPGGAKAGRFKEVAYFNGGIFSESAAIELDPLHEIAILKKAATYNWAHVSPDIFGTIFQHSMTAADRHAYGAHYTSQLDIMKIVGPTIVQPWRTAIAQARSVEALRKLQQRLYTFKVLDPACGSGNFLYIAYRELKRIEKELLDRIREVAPKKDQGQREFGFVTSKQFFGMDILPFAVELAKVTMTLAHKLAIDELHIEEKALPLDNLDTNIICADALISGFGISGTGVPPVRPDEPEARARTPAPDAPRGNRAPFPRTPWPQADAIIGNPPFLGAKRLKPERGADYVNAVRAAYPEVPGMADYCVYWFRRAHDHLKPATPEDPFTGRAGLVGTQNIRNNQSRVGGLDHIAKSGVIIEAVENQPWSGEANVHVSIANWVKLPSSPGPTGGGGRVREAGGGEFAPPPLPAGEVSRGSASDGGGASNSSPGPTGGGGRVFEAGGGVPGSPSEISNLKFSPSSPALLLPTPRRLWTKVDPKSPLFAKDTDHPRPAVVTRGKRGEPRKDKSFEMALRETNHISPSLSDETDVSQAKALSVNADGIYCLQGVTPGYAGFVLNRSQARAMESDSRRLIKPYVIGRELANGDGKAQRYLIDADGLNVMDLLKYPAAKQHLESQVLPKVMASYESEKKKKSDMIDARADHVQRWWTFWARRTALRAWMTEHSRFIAASRTQRTPFIFIFLSTEALPGDKLQLWTLADDYSFGIIGSDAHCSWYRAKAARLKNEADYNYSSASVFDTFPWPQSPTRKNIDAVAAAGREIRRIRAQTLPTIKGGLRALYRTLELPGKNPLKDAHAALDAATLAAYCFSPAKDLLKQLLDLNLTVAAAIDKGEDVTAPGIPPTYGDPPLLITDDCIQP